MADKRAQEVNAVIGKRIRAARKERCMSLAELGDDQLSRSFLSKVERGESNISVRALAIVASRLDLPISYFLDEQIQLIDAPAIDRADVALAYSLALYRKGDPDQALAYALRAVELTMPSEKMPA